MSPIHSRALELLRQSLGNPDANFHEHQWESISALVENSGRLLVVQRTGWGKSAVYFIATKLLREKGHGPTIIISPLLALMRNQVESAARYGVRLGTINSSISREKNEGTEVGILNDQFDAIIISPEQLSKPDFNDNVIKPIADKVGLFVIDEAHCISDWGHDFRPDYKRIKNILSFLPTNLPVIATTATANKRVMDDVCTQLGKDVKMYRGKLTRESLHLQSIHFPKRSQRLAWLADRLPEMEGTGIIYTATIKDGEKVTGWLQSRGLNVELYHGSTDKQEREALEQKLLNNEIKALVATSALGMGYDKPDLSFVIHYQSPGSVVSYYQQVGRAGRGIPKAHGVLLSGSEDDDIQRYFISQAFPNESLVNDILNVLEDSDDGLQMKAITYQINARPKKIEAAIRFLLAENPAPIIVSQQNPIIFSRTLINYQLPRETIQRLCTIKEREWEVMQDYLTIDTCLMQRLAKELDDDLSEPCGKCENCDPDNALPQGYEHATAIAASEYLENIFIDIPPKKRAGSGHAQARSRFPIYGFPYQFGELQHEVGRALCRWGEAGWGEIAKNGKTHNQFDNRLVAASAKMIRERWNPNPHPTWITYVPSHMHPTLVATFAGSLAEALGIPCINAIHKIRKNAPQKAMENTDFRCQNLDGVFEIIDDIPVGPVFLVDDAYDSGWTFAVIAALLRQNDSGPVYPFAIMSTSTTA